MKIDLDLQGKAIISTVPNSTGTVVTWNPTSKEIGTRSNADIISDLGLITATNIAAAYYTKTQLQTPGQAQVNWGNLTDVPAAFTPAAHNHDDRYYTETESDNKFVPYTGADKPVNLNTQELQLSGTLNKQSSLFEISHLSNNAFTSAHFKRLTDVASLSLSSSTGNGDIIITIPIRTSTRWMMEVDIFSNVTLVEKLIISAYHTTNSFSQVSCLTDTEIVSEVKFCRDANNNTVLILKRATGTSSFTYGKVNINNFYHGVTYHADLAVKSNYKVEFIDESTLTGITVGGIMKVDKVNFGTKNVDFTSGAISKTQNSVRHFRDVYQAISGSANTDKILSIKFPPQSAQAMMFRVEIDFYQYAANSGSYNGKLIVSFYKPSNTSIHASTGLSFYWIGDKLLPTNTIKVGFDSSGNISINIGDSTTDWLSYFSFRVSSLEVKYTGYNYDHSKGWTHEFVSDETGFTGLVTVPLTISANQDWVNTQITNAGHSHSNKANLDTINQNLGTTQSPIFAGLTVNGDILAGGNIHLLSKNNKSIVVDWASNSLNPLMTMKNFPGFGIFWKEGATDSFIMTPGGNIANPELEVTTTNIFFKGSGVWHSGNFTPSNYYTKTESGNLFVGLTGVQTIADTKTFSSSPIVPAPTLDSHAVNKGWIISQDYLTSASLTGYATQTWVTSNFASATHTHSWSQITGKPDFATVATTGNYSDLIGLPTIPTQYTDEMAQDAVGAMASSEFTYNDATNTFGINAIGANKITQSASYRFVTDVEKNTWNAKQAALSGTGFVKISGSTISYDNNTYSLSSHNHTLDSLSNVTINLNTAGEILKWNGTAWVNNTLSEAGIQPAGNYALATHGHAIADVTGLQTALDGKVDDSQVLTNVPAGAVFTDTVYDHPTTPGNKHIPSGGSAGQILRWSANGTAVWGADNNTTYNAGTKAEITTDNTNTRVWSGAVLNTMFADYMPTTHAANGITAANITAWNNKYTLPTGGTTSQYINGLGNLATFPTISVYNGIGPGLVPVRGAGGTTTKFLNETGSWVIPPDTTYSVGTVSNIENGDPTAKVWTGETIHEYALNNYIEQAHPVNNITSTNITNWNTAHGWGNHNTAGYALANGSNASGAWANSSNGLENNPTLPGKTMNGSVTSSLQNANNGTIAGYLNSAGTAAGNPDANWWYRIKMLHPNSAGYNGEIAVQMTGSLSMRYRRMEAGSESGWIKTLDEATNSFISGMNSFRTTGNQYDSMALHAYSDTAASPAIAFHKAGVYAGSIAMINSGLFQFRDLAGTGLVNTQVNISYSQHGFVHNGHNDQDILLTSNGDAIHKKDSILPKVVQTTQNFEYLDLTVNLEFREYQVIIWNDAATINIPAASSAIMGMKIVIKLEEGTTIYNAYPILEVNGNQWGTIINDHKIGVELVCRGDSWVSTLIGQTTEIVL